jgi:hypothetical protein
VGGTLVRRRLVALSVAAAVALPALGPGCGGGGAKVDWAGAQALQLGGPERCGPPEQTIRLDLRRLELERDRWKVVGSFVNDSDVPLRIFRPHTGSGTYFGLVVLAGATPAEIERRARERRIHVQLVADRFQPALPRLVAPGEGWRGTFSGPGRLPRGRDARVVLGRFSIKGHAPPVGFLCISERGARIE